MATTISQLGDMVQGELVASTIYETARAARPGLALIAQDAFRGSNIKSYTRFAKVSADALVEANDLTFTDMSDSQVSATLAEYGLGTLLKDTVDVAGTPAEIAMKIAVELGLGFADYIDTLILAKSANLTDSVGTTGQALTEDTWLDGITACVSNDIGGRPLACILHPFQAGQLRKAMTGTTENQSPMANAQLSTLLGPAQPSGFSFRYHGVDIYESTNVPDVNTAADHGGMFIVPGMDAPILIAMGIQSNGQIWFGRTAVQRDDSHRATELIVTGFLGICVPAPERGARVLSVHAT